MKKQDNKVKAVVFNVRLNSLYSIRIPFTWQSALTYPILPPSAVIGLVANALQRYKNNEHPSQYLKHIEEKLVWASSRLITPCIVKSYTVSAITKWEDNLGAKFTNALGRQFAYSRNMQILCILRDDSSTTEIAEAIASTPLTCGDSESPISLEGEIKVANADFLLCPSHVTTRFPFPFTEDIKIIQGAGRIYRMHERCLKTGDSFPLMSYLIPIRERNGILEPTSLTIEISEKDFKVLSIEDVGEVVIQEPERTETHNSTQKRKKR